jgi:hypothetical protein
MTVPAPHNAINTLSLPASRRRRGKVPDFLVRETIDGIPFYFKDYKAVIQKKKTLDEIMADSGLQAFIKKYLYDLLLKRLDDAVFEVYMGEVGAHLEHKINMGFDLAVFETQAMTGDKIDYNYLNVTPVLVVEVDMKVSLDDTGLQSFEDFLNLKTQRLFDFGTKRLLWVLTRSKKVVVAVPGEDWKIVDWNKDIEVWPGIKANIAKHLEKRKINPF